MAYNVSEKWREKVYSGNSMYKCNLTINDEVIPIEQIRRIKISSPLIDKSNSKFYIGTFISQSLTITFRNLDGINVKSGDEVYLEISQYIDETTGYETVPIGKFLIDDLAENYTTSCEITCLDYAVKFKPNIDYSPVFGSSNTASIDDILAYICEYFDVELGEYPDINGNIQIGTYDSSVSGKQYISYIAELKGCNAKIDRDGKLTLVPIKSEPIVTINALKSKSFQKSEKYIISRVVYQDAIRKFEAGEDINNTLYLRMDNPYIVDQNVIDNLYNQINGLEICSLKCENYGDVSLDSWDVIRYELDEDETGEKIYYDTYNNNEIIYEMTVMSTVETSIPTLQQQEVTNIIGGENDSVRLRIMRTEINQNTGDIKILTSTTTDIKENVENNYYSKTQTNELIQNSSEGITNTFSEAGGNNVFRNTGLWFKESSNQTLNYLFPSETLYPSENTFAVEQANWEYWAGFALKVSNDQATLNTAIRLQKGSFVQDQDVPNGSYSISFTYKKLISLAETKVTINDKEYKLDSEEWKQFYTGEQDQDGNYITFPVEVTSRHISIKFYSDTNNALELYDLMCNKGTVKLAYSQNENEVTTDTVNISKGITITSSTTDTKFKADSDGIRILNKNDDAKITEFTEKGMTTKEAVVENEATIVKLLIQDINDQTWLTRM